MLGIQIAFKDYMVSKGIMGSEWVGLKYFYEFFNSFQFKRLITNTVTISFYQIIAGFPFPIILALLINQHKSKLFKQSIQMITYAPYFISVVVLVSMILELMSTTGIVNNLLSVLGFQRIDFLGKSVFFKSLYVWSGIWQNTGYSSIIYIAVLSTIDPSLHEAAIMDGANKLKRILHVDIPGILPTAVILLIMDVGRVMDVGFEKIYLMQNPLNMVASDVISTYVYRIGLLNAQYSFTTAVGLFNSVVNLILLVCVNQLAKKLGHASLW